MTRRRDRARRRRSRAAPALVLAAALQGCGTDSPRPDDRPAAVAGLVEEMRTPPTLEFSGISALDVDSRGRIYVADGKEIVTLRPDGTEASRMGREGYGPGEFQWISTLALLPRDSLYVYDGGLRRITVYAPGKTRPAYTTTIPGPQTVTPYWAQPTGAGILAAYRTALGDVPGRERGERLPVVVRLLNADASVRRDSLLLLRERQSLRIYNGEGRGHLFFPFARSSQFAVSRAGLVYAAWTDSLRFTAHALDGTPRWSHAEPFTPRAVTQQEMDSVVAELAQPPFSASTVRRALSETGTHTWPAFRHFLVDDRERLWVGLTPGPGAADAEWLVLNRSGRVGSVRLPEPVQILTVRGDRAYGVTRDENDVHAVVVYRVQPGPAGKEAR